MKFLWHRIRGHKIKHTREWITFMDYSFGPGGMESGYDRHRKVCSCGTTWRPEFDPYTTRRRWV